MAAGLVTAVFLATFGGAPPAAPAAPPPQPAAAAAPSRRFADANDLLTALETADGELHTLSANIRYFRDFGDIEGSSTQEWQGTLYFDADLPAPPAARPPAPGAAPAPPRRGFAVAFEKSIVDGRVRNDRRDFVFDGQWFVERLHAERQVILRRVVPPGEVADPLKIGEGPFPIPIGQRRGDILARFDAELLAAGDGWPEGQAPASVAGAWQLRLVPREGTDEAREFREVRLWYQEMKDPSRPESPPRLLPRLARTVNIDGGTVEVLLSGLAPNSDLPDGVFDTAPPPRTAGWDVHIQEFRGRFDNDK